MPRRRATSRLCSAGKNRAFLSGRRCSIRPESRAPLRNSHQDSSSSSPLVCKSFLISFPLAYFCCPSTACRSKSCPSSVGSPPCQVKTTVSNVLPHDALADELLEQLVRKRAGGRLGQQVLLVQIIAVRAIEVARRHPPASPSRETIGSDGPIGLRILGHSSGYAPNVRAAKGRGITDYRCSILAKSVMLPLSVQ